MPDLGTLKHDGGRTFVLVSYWHGCPPVRHETWADVEQIRIAGQYPPPTECIIALRAQPSGTAIAWQQLPQIEILSRPLVERIDDLTFEALLREAEIGGGGRWSSVLKEMSNDDQPRRQGPRSRDRFCGNSDRSG